MYLASCGASVAIVSRTASRTFATCGQTASETGEEPSIATSLIIGSLIQWLSITVAPVMRESARAIVSFPTPGKPTTQTMKLLRRMRVSPPQLAVEGVAGLCLTAFGQNGKYGSIEPLLLRRTR